MTKLKVVYLAAHFSELSYKYKRLIFVDNLVYKVALHVVSISILMTDF